MKQVLVAMMKQFLEFAFSEWSVGDTVKVMAVCIAFVGCSSDISMPALPDNLEPTQSSAGNTGESTQSSASGGWDWKNDFQYCIHYDEHGVEVNPLFEACYNEHLDNAYYGDTLFNLFWMNDGFSLRCSELFGRDGDWHSCQRESKVSKRVGDSLYTICNKCYKYSDYCPDLGQSCQWPERADPPYKGECVIQDCDFNEEVQKIERANIRQCSRENFEYNLSLKIDNYDNCIMQRKKEAAARECGCQLR